MVTDVAKNDKKDKIQQEDISKKNRLKDGKSSTNSKSLISNDITAAKTCNDSQSVGKRKDNKQVFIVGDSVIKHLKEVPTYYQQHMHEKYQIYFNENAFYVALMEGLLVVVL